MTSSNYITNGSPVAIPAVSKHGFVRSHGTGEFAERRTRSGYDGKPKGMSALVAKEAKRQAARAQMAADGWL